MGRKEVVPFEIRKTVTIVINNTKKFGQNEGKISIQRLIVEVSLQIEHMVSPLIVFSHNISS